MSFPKTIKRTRGGRRYPLYLRAAEPDAGPYYLVTIDGLGVAWKKPAYGRGLSRTWVPVFERARLAFELVDQDDNLTPRQAKEIVNKAYAHLGNQNPTPAQLENYAFRLVDKLNAKKNG